MLVTLRSGTFTVVPRATPLPPTPPDLGPERPLPDPAPDPPVPPGPAPAPGPLAGVGGEAA